MQTIPEQIKSQSGPVVRIETAQGTAVISRKDAERLLKDWQLVKTFEGWRVKR